MNVFFDPFPAGPHQLKIASYLAKALELSSYFHECFKDQPAPKLTKHLQACLVTLRRYIETGCTVAPELRTQYQALCVELGETTPKVIIFSFLILFFIHSDALFLFFLVVVTGNIFTLGWPSL